MTPNGGAQQSLGLPRELRAQGKAGNCDCPPRRPSLFYWLDVVCRLVNKQRHVGRACCVAKDVSMGSRRLAILGQIRRGLLAAVCVFGSMLPSDFCCCGAFSCCAAQDESVCFAVESAQGCCCCTQSHRKNDSGFACSCAEIAVNPSAFFLGTCCCDEHQATNGVVVNNHRDDQKRIGTRGSWN